VQLKGKMRTIKNYFDDIRVFKFVAAGKVALPFTPVFKRTLFLRSLHAVMEENNTTYVNLI
jgi:hypothetical protein